MREHTKWIMLLTAVAFVGLMVFQWGMDLTGRSAQASAGRIGKINGEEISSEEFLVTYRKLYQEQSQNQTEPIGTAQNRQLEEAAWQQIVADHLIQQEIRRRGITASDEEIRQAARYAPPPEFYNNQLFQTDGRFDPAKYQQFLASNSVDPNLLLQLESYYRDIIPRSKLAQQVTSGVYVPDSELWRMWVERSQTARVRFIALDPDALVPAAAVTVSDKEVRDYYDQHQKDYEQPARATVKYVALPRVASAADTALARQHALDIRQRLLGGADFAEIADKESSDRASARNGGSLGTFMRGQMVPEFDRAAFTLPIGQISEPVQTQYGFHIIEIEKREGDRATGRHILIPIRDGEANEEALVSRADSLQKLGEQFGLERAAQQMGLAVRQGSLTQEDPFLAGIGPADDGAEWAFTDAEPGQTSEVFENSNGFYMTTLVKKIPAGPLPFELAKPGIQTQLVRERKLEKAKQVGRDIVDEIRSGKSLDAVASARHLTVGEAGPFTRLDYVNGLGRGNAAVGAAFGLKPGQTSGVVEADGALFILQLVEKSEPDRAAFDAQKNSLRTQAMQAMEQQRWTDFLLALKEEAQIVDNRQKVLHPTPEDTLGAGLGR